MFIAREVALRRRASIVCKVGRRRRRIESGFVEDEESGELILWTVEFGACRTQRINTGIANALAPRRHLQVVSWLPGPVLQ